jgi:excisionase family DNA binding protein
MPRSSEASELTVLQVAQRLGVSVREVRYLIARGRLEARKLPGGRTSPFLVSLPSVLREEKRRQSVQD